MGCEQYCTTMYAHDARRFLTREEKIEMLNEYKEQLEREAQGVAERIEELKKVSEE